MEALPAERLASLGRAAIECQRFASPLQEQLSAAWDDALGQLERPQRKTTLEELGRLLASPATGASADRERAGGGGSAKTTQEALRQRASLELKLQTEQERCKELEATIQRERNEQREARESLVLQQRKLKQLQEERSALLSQISDLESNLRRQINETEQVQLKYQKLTSSRRTVSEQTTEQAEQMTALQAENERLRKELEAALQERDTHVADAQVKVEAAEAETADAVLKRLWAGMHGQIPDVFIDTHVPTQRTFEHLCEVLVDFVRTFATLERHVHHMLRDLRQVSERTDALNRFYIMFTKNPGLAETLRDYLTSGKRKGNFANLLRAQQAWARAFGSGAYKAIVRSPNLVQKELNYRSWGVKSSFGVSEDAALGKHFKETVYKTAPENIGTSLRKDAADMAHEDYNTVMKTRSPR
jgi:hypothetical protein